jgi:antitoxin component of MazEF toxin-antitoxin module
MIQKVHKFGNSLAVVIPTAENKLHGIEPGAIVEVVETADGWQVRPMEVVPKISAEIKAIADDLAEKRAKVFDVLAQ